MEKFTSMLNKLGLRGSSDDDRQDGKRSAQSTPRLKRHLVHPGGSSGSGGITSMVRQSLGSLSLNEHSRTPHMLEDAALEHYQPPLHHSWDCGHIHGVDRSWEAERVKGMELLYQSIEKYEHDKTRHGRRKKRYNVKDRNKRRSQSRETAKPEPLITTKEEWIDHPKLVGDNKEKVVLTRQQRLAIARMQQQAARKKGEAAMREGLMRELERERMQRLNAEQRVRDMSAENDSCKSRLTSLQNDFKKMEDLVHSMVQYKSMVDQLKNENANLTSSYEMNTDKYRTHISDLEEENQQLTEEMSRLESQPGKPDDDKSKVLMERLRRMEMENSALVLENERQRQQYEKCLDDIANQVVHVLLSQKGLREDCMRLQQRVLELEQHNQLLCHLLQDNPTNQLDILTHVSVCVNRDKEKIPAANSHHQHHPILHGYHPDAHQLHSSSCQHLAPSASSSSSLPLPPLLTDQPPAAIEASPSVIATNCVQGSATGYEQVSAIVMNPETSSREDGVMSQCENSVAFGIAASLTSVEGPADRLNGELQGLYNHGSIESLHSICSHYNEHCQNDELLGKSQMSSPPPWLRDKKFSYHSTSASGQSGSPSNFEFFIHHEEDEDDSPSERYVSSTHSGEHAPNLLPPAPSQKAATEKEPVNQSLGMRSDKLGSTEQSGHEKQPKLIDQSKQENALPPDSREPVELNCHLRTETEFPANNDNPKKQHIGVIYHRNDLGQHRPSLANRSELDKNRCAFKNARSNNGAEQDRKETNIIRDEAKASNHSNQLRDEANIHVSDEGRMETHSAASFEATRLELSPGKELLQLNDSFHEKYMINEMDGLPKIRNDLYSSDTDSSENSRPQSHDFSMASTVSLNEILEKELDDMETPLDDDFSVDQLNVYGFTDEKTGMKPESNLSHHDGDGVLNSHDEPALSNPEKSRAADCLNNQLRVTLPLKDNFEDFKHNQFDTLSNRVKETNADLEAGTMLSTKIASDSCETVLNNSKSNSLTASPKMKRPNSLELRNNLQLELLPRAGHDFLSDSDTSSSDDMVAIFDGSPTPTNMTSQTDVPCKKRLSSQGVGREDGSAPCEVVDGLDNITKDNSPYNEVVELFNLPMIPANSDCLNLSNSPDLVEQMDLDSSLLQEVKVEVMPSSSCSLSSPTPVNDLDKVHSMCGVVTMMASDMTSSSGTPDSAMQQSLVSSSSSDHSLTGKPMSRDDGYSSNSAVSVSSAELQRLTDQRARKPTNNDGGDGGNLSEILETSMEYAPSDLHVESAQLGSCSNTGSNSTIESIPHGRVKGIKKFFEKAEKTPPPVPPKPQRRQIIPVEIVPHDAGKLDIPSHAPSAMPKHSPDMCHVSVPNKPTHHQQIVECGHGDVSSVDLLRNCVLPSPPATITGSLSQMSNDEVLPLPPPPDTYHSKSSNSLTYRESNSSDGLHRLLSDQRVAGHLVSHSAESQSVKSDYHHFVKLPHQSSSISRSEVTKDSSDNIHTHDHSSPNNTDYICSQPPASHHPYLQRQNSCHVQLLSRESSSITDEEPDWASIPDRQSMSDTFICKNKKQLRERKAQTLQDRMNSIAASENLAAKAISEQYLSLKRQGRLSKFRNIKEALLQDWRKLQQKLTSQRRLDQSKRALPVGGSRPGSLLPRRFLKKSGEEDHSGLDSQTEVSQRCTSGGRGQLVESSEMRVCNTSQPGDLQQHSSRDSHTQQTSARHYTKNVMVWSDSSEEEVPIRKRMDGSWEGREALSGTLPEWSGSSSSAVQGNAQFDEHHVDNRPLLPGHDGGPSLSVVHMTEYLTKDKRLAYSPTAPPVVPHFSARLPGDGLHKTANHDTPLSCQNSLNMRQSGLNSNGISPPKDETDGMIGQISVGTSRGSVDDRNNQTFCCDDNHTCAIGEMSSNGHPTCSPAIQCLNSSSSSRCGDGKPSSPVSVNIQDTVLNVQYQDEETEVNRDQRFESLSKAVDELQRSLSSQDNNGTDDEEETTQTPAKCKRSMKRRGPSPTLQGERDDVNNRQDFLCRMERESGEGIEASPEVVPTCPPLEGVHRVLHEPSHHTLIPMSAEVVGKTEAFVISPSSAFHPVKKNSLHHHVSKSDSRSRGHHAHRKPGGQMTLVDYGFLDYDPPSNTEKLDVFQEDLLQDGSREFQLKNPFRDVTHVVYKDGTVKLNDTLGDNAVGYSPHRGQQSENMTLHFPHKVSKISSTSVSIPQHRTVQELKDGSHIPESGRSSNSSFMSLHSLSMSDSCYEGYSTGEH